MFLVIALSSDDGQDALAVVLFGVIGWSDYLDGFAARLTGQYSRLGALLDPLVDRLLIVSGMVVCWHFSLLPRWAIAIVIAREVFMLVASRYALSHGIEIQINWAGRIGVAPIAGAPFFAMAGVHWLALDHAVRRDGVRADRDRDVRASRSTGAARSSRRREGPRPNSQVELEPPILQGYTRQLRALRPGSTRRI